MADLNWLHLSDWHQKGKDFDREVVDEEAEKVGFLPPSVKLNSSGKSKSGKKTNKRKKRKR